MRLATEAFHEWTKTPTGPSIGDILARLRKEAIERGELDAKSN